MRLGWTKNKNSITYRAVKTIRVNGKNQTMVIKTFGSDKYICETYGVTDAKAWAKEQVRLMNEAEQGETPSFHITLCSGTDLELQDQRKFNGGYLFLQDIYYELGLDKICTAIRTRHGFDYNLNSILSRLLYTRILFPSSKRSSHKDSLRFIEQPDFELHQVYRALSVLASDLHTWVTVSFGTSLSLASLSAMYASYQISVRQATISLSLLLTHTSQHEPWESLWGSSATMPLVVFHHRRMPVI